MGRTLVLTDNPHAVAVVAELERAHGGIDVFQSPDGPLEGVPRLDVRADAGGIAGAYDLVLSIHCKQFFPPELTRAVRCVNVHPGLNPFNRGWFPQVFSIINGLPAGVTIHEIDDQLDHGPIIVQQGCELKPWDTSGSAYARIMEIERALLLEHFAAIRAGSYRAVPMASEGNLNRRKDFDRLKAFDRDEVGRFGDFIDRLRALTHEPYRNAYFVDAAGRKVFMRLVLEPEAGEALPVEER